MNIETITINPNPGLTRLNAVSAGILFLTGILTCACAAERPAKCRTSDSTCLSELALSGDGDAALQLAQDNIHDRVLLKKWTQIAAENGSEVGAHNLGFTLMASSKNRADCVRALFWFRKAAEKRSTESIELAKRLTIRLEKDKRDRTCSDL